MFPKLTFTVILGIDLYRFEVECFDKIFNKKVDLRGGGRTKIEHAICRVNDRRDGGERWRNRHQVLFNHLLLDLFFLLRRYVGSSIGTHPGLFLLLAPCLEHGRRNLALRFAQTDVNQIVPKHGALFYLGIQQTTSRCPANLRLILDQFQTACAIGVQQIYIVLRQLLREYK